MSSTSACSTSCEGSPPPPNRMHPHRLAEISSAMRRGFSFPDFQSESSAAAVAAGIACRYSPEEKRARIERYRNKRSQRNFTKKIKYACRKTLADRRPRVRGRFARNEEEGEESVGVGRQQKHNKQQQQQQLWLEEVGEDCYFGENFWVRLLQSSSSFPFSP